jgi:hypothetical protein
MKSEATTLQLARSAKFQEFSGATLQPRQIPGVHHIELNLRDIEQLFNTMDPSPFHEKDLDHDAEEFIFGWAQEFHRHEPVDLIVHLEKLPDGRDAKRLVEAPCTTILPTGRD